MSPLDEARAACGRLKRWLADAATPLWSDAGLLARADTRLRVAS